LSAKRELLLNISLRLIGIADIATPRLLQMPTVVGNASTGDGFRSSAQVS
jgi:hypothetical protein